MVERHVTGKDDPTAMYNFPTTGLVPIVGTRPHTRCVAALEFSFMTCTHGMYDSSPVTEN